MDQKLIVVSFNLAHVATNKKV